MKKSIFTLLSLLLYFSSFAQYESFFGKNSTSYSQFYTYEWWGKGESAFNSFSIVGLGYTFDSHFTKDDTVRINDLLYYKTFYIPKTSAPETYGTWVYWGGTGHIEFDFYLREDTTSGRLYHYCAGTDRERLWCDMSLQVGDTFYFPLNEQEGFGYFLGDGISKGYTIVSSIDYVNNKKIINFPFYVATYVEKPYTPQPIAHRLQLKFIEGIGPLYGPSTAKVNNEGYEREVHHTILLCVHKDDTLTYMTNPVLGCDQYHGWTPHDMIKERKNMELKLSLNQENTELKIELPYELENEKGDIYLLDMAGRILYNQALNSNPQTINISNLTSGLYIVNFQTKKYHFTTKFIKNR